MSQEKTIKTNPNRLYDRIFIILQVAFLLLVAALDRISMPILFGWLTTDPNHHYYEL